VVLRQNRRMANISQEVLIPAEKLINFVCTLDFSLLQNSKRGTGLRYTHTYLSKTLATLFANWCYITRSFESNSCNYPETSRGLIKVDIKNMFLRRSF
jgi:hypothetical protein